MNRLNSGVKLTWLGHSTWLIESPGGKRMLIDPWLTENPSCPDQFKGDALGELDIIICSHGHFDHVGDLVPLAQQTGASVVGIFDLVSWAQSKGVANGIGGNKGGTIQVDGVKVTLVNAVHSSSFNEEGQSIDMGDPCGVVIEFENGYKIYNTGDTDVFGDMALIAQLYEPDAVMMPIGDHFTMGPKQAAKAVELMNAKVVIPQHYGTFPLLTGTPDALRELVGGDVEILAVNPGETIQ